jgi:hypothetical protein
VKQAFSVLRTALVPLTRAGSALLLTAATAFCSSAHPGGSSSDGGSSKGVDALPSEEDTSTPGSQEIFNDGPATCDGGRPQDASAICPATSPTTLTILGSSFAATGNTISYGTAPNQWVAYPVASSGQTAPVLTASSGAVSVAVTIAPGSTAGVGLSIAHDCVDIAMANLNAVGYQITGTLGGCSLAIVEIIPQDESSAADPCRGMCAGESADCIAPSLEAPVSETSVVLGYVPGGSPSTSLQNDLIGLQWRLQPPDDASAGCVANFTLSNVAFVQ